jgi:hypothetical protein
VYARNRGSLTEFKAEGGDVRCQQEKADALEHGHFPSLTAKMLGSSSKLGRSLGFSFLASVGIANLKATPNG